jgi:hypothetical protein
MTLCALLLSLLILCPAATSGAEEPSVVQSTHTFRASGINHTVVYFTGVPYSRGNKPTVMVSGGRFEIMLNGATGQKEAHEIELTIPTFRWRPTQR